MVGLYFLQTQWETTISNKYSEVRMDFFNSAITVLQTLVIALGAGLCIWGGVNLLEGYGQDNPASNAQG